MKKVDETIETLCDWLRRELNEENQYQENMLLPEMVKALAELVAARAMVD